MVASEDINRQQVSMAVQRSLDSIKEDLLAEAKERRAQYAQAVEDIGLVQRGLQQRDDRSESTSQQFMAEASELRERLAREARMRETALSQIEQQLASVRASGGIPGAHAASVHTFTEAPVPRGMVSNDRFRQAEEEMERTRLAVVSLQSEQAALSKAMAGLDERCESTRSALNAAQGGVAEVQHRHSGSQEVDSQFAAIREELRKE